jgi:hypothetical protein
MTEEIIIDVTKCDFNTFDGGGSQRTICTLDNCYCDGIRAKDCYFKELKRLEQENKNLKKQIESDKGLITVGGKQQYQYLQRIDKLEQENKELKEWKDKVVKLFESACRCKYLNEESDICSYTNKKCININKCVYKYQELSENYRSALEEIKEIAMGIMDDDIDEGSAYYDADQIINKINEVLNESK